MAELNRLLKELTALQEYHRIQDFLPELDHQSRVFHLRAASDISTAIRVLVKYAPMEFDLRDY